MVGAAWAGAPALAAGVVATDPITNEVGVDLDSDIGATFNAAISPSTVNVGTFVAQGMMSGRRSGAFSFSGANKVATLNPSADFFPGEVVRVSATRGISDVSSLPVTPYQWQFTAGTVKSRCCPSFTDIAAGLAGVASSSGAWGDFDGDGDLDMVVAGIGSGDVAVSRIYRNDGGGTFTDIDAGLTGVYAGAVVWGDYDSDGDLDLLLLGLTTTGGGEFVARIYRNDGGSSETSTPA